MDDLRIRADPAIDAAEASCGNSPSSPARLGVGDVVWITDAEPRVRDAYLWYQVVASNQTCELALMAGWVAAGPADDSEWIQVFDDECPGPAAPGDLPPSPLARLECYAGERLTLHGVLPRIPDGIGFTCPGIEPTWLTCGIDTLTQAGDSEIGISIRTPPDVEAPPRGQLIVATGSFDNPRAEGCVEPARRFSTLVVEIYCRSQFIVESMASEE